MTTLTEGRHALEFLLSPGNGNISFDNVTLHGGFTGAGKLKAGTVLGKITSGGKYAASPASGSDGSQTAVAILAYNADITNGETTTPRRPPRQPSSPPSASKFASSQRTVSFKHHSNHWRPRCPKFSTSLMKTPSPWSA